MAMLLRLFGLKALRERPSLTDQEQRDLSLGVTHARWLHPGVDYISLSCAAFNIRGTDDAELIDDAHRAADGKVYPIVDGLLVNGKMTAPGREPGCKCVSLSIIPGLEDMT